MVETDGQRSLTLLEASWHLAVEEGDAHDVASVGVSLTDRLLVMSSFAEAGLRARRVQAAAVAHRVLLHRTDLDRR